MKCIEKLCPTGKIFEVERHKRPYAVSEVFDLIDDNEPIFIVLRLLLLRL